MVSNLLYGGIDIGASAVKVVLLDRSATRVGEAVERTGVDLSLSALECVKKALNSVPARENDLAGIVTTGFGRYNVPFDSEARTEISCHAKGCFHFFPQEMTVIDIGGQDNKVIRLDNEGKIVDFKMNRKCAAGTGAFLEEIAQQLGVELSKVDSIARSATETAVLGSYCTVFTKTEILTRMRQGTSLPSLLRGALESVVKRVLEMSMPQGDVVMSGGVVAHNPLVVTLMQQHIKGRVLVPPSPQTIGALGAAIFALERGVTK